MEVAERGGNRDQKMKENSKGNEEGLYRKLRLAATVHPDLRVDYFHTIDTREKAYWLGFLYADGYLSRWRKEKGIEIGIKLGRKDEDTIDRFCDFLGLDKTRKEYHALEESEYVRIRFTCRKMSDDLIRHGVKFGKSKIIQYPRESLHNRDLELAFLLGYYDGDGIKDTTIIVSGSKGFLEEIKNRFNLPYKIREEITESEIHDIRVIGTRSRMCLGPELFNEMMKNYEQSMHRKRRLFCDAKERARRSAEACKPEKVWKRIDALKEWRAITDNELEELARRMPLTQIAIKYNLSSASKVTRKCRKFGISIPERGYWQKLRWTKGATLDRGST
nr:hypothetical protein [Candidatus Njordarchaeota archaeon]